MILPTKHLRQDRSLIGVGAEILLILDSPKTVSALWNDLMKNREALEGASTVPFDWFILSLDLLHSINVIEYNRGRLRRTNL